MVLQLVLLPYERGGREGWSKLHSAASPSRRPGGVVEIATRRMAKNNVRVCLDNKIRIENLDNYLLQHIS